MAPITRTVQINAPIEEAFDCVNNPAKTMIWAEGVEQIIPLEPYDLANPVGSRFKQVIREGGRAAEYVGEIIAYDKPHHLGITLGNAAFTMEVHYRFSAAGSGTRLDYSAEMIRANLLGRVMGVLFGWLTGRILDKQMARLKQVAETGS